MKIYSKSASITTLGESCSQRISESSGFNYSGSVGFGRGLLCNFLVELFFSLLRRSTRLVTYTVKIGNIIMPSAASSTDSTRPVGVTAMILEPTVVTSINAHHKASPYPLTKGLGPCSMT